MAIHFNLKSCPLTARRDRSDKSTVPAVSVLSEKAAELMERAKLMRAISELEDEIALQMCAIGELIYATHRGNPSDSDEMQKILSYVDDLHDQIEGHEQQLLILQGIYSCPICGENVTEGDVYCLKCGQPLPVSFTKQS